MIKQKLIKGDVVIVTTGKDKGKTGKILSVFPVENKAVVQGINLVSKHQKLSRTSESGIVKKEMKINISNLAFLANNGKPSKIAFKTLEDGSKVRIAKKTGETIASNYKS